MRLRGIQYIYDNQGKKISAVVDLRRYEKEFAVFMDQLSKRNSSSQPSPNPTPVIGDTIDVIGGGTTSLRAREIKVEALLQTARSYYGVPYRTGGVSHSGMDCSGFTQTSFNAVGVKLPRVSRDQATLGKPMRKAELQPGDLVFFATGTPGRINHVGIITDVSDASNVRFIHASSSRGVMETSLNMNYWTRNYIKARRMM